MTQQNHKKKRRKKKTQNSSSLVIDLSQHQIQLPNPVNNNDNHSNATLLPQSNSISPHSPQSNLSPSLSPLINAPDTSITIPPLLTDSLHSHTSLTTSQESADGINSPSFSFPNLGLEEEGELGTYSYFLYIVVEILHSSITHNLPQNAHLLYALLYQQDLFPPFANHPKFRSLILGIQSVLQYFTMELEQAKLPDFTAETILSFLQHKSKSYKPYIPPSFEPPNPSRFRYEEADSCGEFFTPFIWNIVYNFYGLHWCAKSTLLLSMNSEA